MVAGSSMGGLMQICPVHLVCLPGSGEALVSDLDLDLVYVRSVDNNSGL